MDSPENKERLEKLFQQLLEMAMGNFSQRIARSDRNDSLEALIALVNKVAERISGRGNSGPVYSQADTPPMFLAIDVPSQTIELSWGALDMLKLNDSDIVDTPLKNILCADSQKRWASITKEMGDDSESGRWERLSFFAKNGLLFPCYSLIIYCPEEKILKGKILVISFDVLSTKRLQKDKLQKLVYGQFQRRPTGSSDSNVSKNILFPADLEIIRTASDYITNHLDDPMALEDICRSVGINEFKLKWGFKKVYGMSVFQYIKDMRLSKAYVLVLYTNNSILSIAKLVGFKKGNHLSREFKKRYGHNPTALRIHAAQNESSNFNTIH